MLAFTEYLSPAGCSPPAPAVGIISQFIAPTPSFGMPPPSSSSMLPVIPSCFVTITKNELSGGDSIFGSFIISTGLPDSSFTIISTLRLVKSHPRPLVSFSSASKASLSIVIVWRISNLTTTQRSSEKE